MQIGPKWAMNRLKHGRDAPDAGCIFSGPDDQPDVHPTCRYPGMTEDE
jgi:hypothetical protein